MKRNQRDKKWYVLATWAIVMLLTACGGGSGGGDDDDPIVASKEQIVVSNSSVTMLADGGEQTINVNANCAWTVTVENGDANWMTVNPKSGVNMGSFTISVTANTTETDRHATLIVAGKTLTRTINVTQRGRETTMTVDVSSLDFGVNGESKSFTISSNGTWTIEAPDWCNLSMKAGSNNREITVTVGQNSTGAERTGEIVVSGQAGKTARINVRQGPSSKMGTKDCPITVAKAIEIVNTLSDNGITEEYAYIKGIIVKISTTPEDIAKYKNIDYLISDDGSDNNTLTVFRGKNINGSDFNEAGVINQGDVVVVYGKLQKYVNNSGVITPELAQGNYIVSINNTTKN